MKTYYVYILQCSDGSYYTGVTHDLSKRIAQHNAGEKSTAYTYQRRPVKLLWYASFSNPETAIAKEKQIKGWSRKKKEVLIKEDYERLAELAKKDFNL